MFTMMLVVAVLPAVVVVAIMAPVAKVYGAYRGKRGYDPVLAGLDAALMTLILYAIGVGIAFYATFPTSPADLHSMF